MAIHAYLSLCDANPSLSGGRRLVGVHLSVAVGEGRVSGPGGHVQAHRTQRTRRVVRRSDSFDATFQYLVSRYSLNAARTRDCSARIA